MKKSVMLVSCFFMIESNLYAVEKLKAHPRIKPEMTVTSAYLLITSFFSAYFIWPWFMDLKKINQCCIYCDQCNFKLSAMEVCGYFAVEGNAKKFYNLKRLLYKADVDQINQYLLKINMQEEQECVNCRDFCGWHIKNG